MGGGWSEVSVLRSRRLKWMDDYRRRQRRLNVGLQDGWKTEKTQRERAQRDEQRSQTRWPLLDMTNLAGLGRPPEADVSRLRHHVQEPPRASTRLKTKAGIFSPDRERETKRGVRARKALLASPSNTTCSRP